MSVFQEYLEISVAANVPHGVGKTSPSHINIMLIFISFFVAVKILGCHGK